MKWRQRAMKQKRSSANPFTHTFAESIRSTNFIVGLIILLGAGFVMVMSILYTITYKQVITNPVTGVQEGVQTAKDMFVYYLFNDNSYAGTFLCGALILGGIVMGMSCFRFITSKKTVNVYYSLGIKREKLFLANYLSGALLIVVAVVLAVMAPVLLNLIYIGSSIELWTAALYYMMAFATVGLFAYTVTAAVASSVGTVFEGGIFSVIISFLPTFVLSSAQMLMDRLVWGSPFGKNFFERLNEFNYDSPSLATHFSYFTPLTAFLDALKGIAFREKTVDEEKAAEKAVEIFELGLKEYIAVFAWLAVVVGVFFLAMYLFKRRKAEISGFIGTNRVLNNLGIMVVSLFAFSVLFSKLPLSTYVALAFAMLGVIIVFLILDAVLRRSLREFRKDLIFLPGHLVVTGLIFVIFSTGLFGYSTRVPEPETVKSASVSLVSVNGIVGEFYSYSSNVLANPVTSEMLSGFTSEKDIKLVRELHTKIAGLGADPSDDMWKFSSDADSKRLRSRVQFTYYLKNGKAVRRSFKDVTADALADMLKIYESDRFRQLVDEALSPDADLTKNEKARALRSEGSIFRAVPGDVTYIARLNLNEQQRNDLLEALRLDLSEQTYKERYFPEKSPIGLISVLNVGEPGFGGKPIYDVNIPSKPDIDIGNDEEPEIPASDEPWDIIDNAPTFETMESVYGGIDFVITEDMERTVKFLKDNNMFDAFKGTEKKYTSVNIVSLERSHTFQPHMLRYENNFSYYVSARATSKPKESQDAFYYNPLDNQQTYTVTDQETIKALKELSYFSYYSKGTGYAVEFKASDDTSQLLYIPASKMPAALATAVRSLDESLTQDFRP
jgi:ABC-type transport system involved in multi-copper enzyme maturation permease subunit